MSRKNKDNSHTIKVTIPEPLYQAIRKVISQGYFENTQEFVEHAIRAALFSSQILPPLSLVVEKKIPKNRFGKLLLAIFDISKKGHATTNDLEEIARLLNMSRAELKEVIDGLVEAGYVYEPRPGSFRALDQNRKDDVT